MAVNRIVFVTHFVIIFNFYTIFLFSINRISDVHPHKLMERCSAGRRRPLFTVFLNGKFRNNFCLNR